MNTIPLQTEAKAWIKKRDGSNEMIHVRPLSAREFCFYIAFEDLIPANYLGRILYDDAGYWIYDGSDLAPSEQEQLVEFINYVNR